MHSASEGDYDKLPEDIVKTLEPPQHVKRESSVYYKFDTMLWSTVHCSVFDVRPCHTVLSIAWFDDLSLLFCVSWHDMQIVNSDICAL